MSAAAAPDRFRRRVALLAAALLLPATLSLYSLTSSGAVALADWMPDRALDIDLPARSTVLAGDGSLLATFFAQDRVPVPLEAVAPAAKDAVLAIEDARFYEHGAIDPVGLLRAARRNLAAGEFREGASTLTQQYVKQALVHEAEDARGRQAATELTLSRKIRELGHALALEKDLTKDEILSRYLNIVYFGNGAWGIEIAARRYFGISARDLSVPQAALLAGVIKGPVNYDPVVNPHAALERRNVVLDRMVATGSLDAAAAAEYKASGLGLSMTRTVPGCAPSPHPFFCDYVLAEVRSMPALGLTPAERVERLLTGGLTVQTTLDPKIQDAAQRAVAERVSPEQEHGAAIVMTEPGTGAVRALALSRGYGDGPGRTEVNWALDAAQGGSHGFQAGSTFKAFMLAAAAARDIAPDTRLRAPGSDRFTDFRRCDGPEVFPPYSVRNYDGRSYGSLDMRSAAARSVNTYFVRLEQRIGLCDGPELAERMGLRRADGQPLSRLPSFTLGVDEVSPLRMAEAYATLAANGNHCPSHAIAAIRDRTGRDLPGVVPGCNPALTQAQAETVTDVLRGVIDGPDPGRTGRAMTLGSVRAAGKTGTTSNATAVWFVGYTDRLAAAVWAGHPDSTKPLRNVLVGGRRHDRLTGGALPGPIWADAMAGALDLPDDPAVRASQVPAEWLTPPAAKASGSDDDLDGWIDDFLEDDFLEEGYEDRQRHEMRDKRDARKERRERDRDRREDRHVDEDEDYSWLDGWY